MKLGYRQILDLESVLEKSTNLLRQLKHRKQKRKDQGDINLLNNAIEYLGIVYQNHSRIKGE